MNFLALILLMLMQQASPAPEIVLQWNEKPTFNFGEKIHLTLDLETADAYSKVKLLPLELHSLGHISTSSSTSTNSNDSKKIHYHFEIIVETNETGNGSIGEFQIELTSVDDKGEEVSSLVTHPGFSLHIARRFSLDEHWPWLLFISALVAAGIFAFMRIRNAGKIKTQNEFSPEAERKERLLKELHELRIRAEWAKAVDLAFSAILTEIATASKENKGDLISRLSAEELHKIAAKWPDFPAIYRLGEEVRYGGYSPDKKESVYISEFLRELYSHSEQENQKHSGENK